MPNSGARTGPGSTSSAPGAARRVSTLTGEIPLAADPPERKRCVPGSLSREVLRGSAPRAGKRAAGVSPGFAALQPRPLAAAPSGWAIPLPAGPLAFASPGLADGQGCSSCCKPNPRRRSGYEHRGRQGPYSRVTDRIVADLAKGVRPWVKPWNAEHAAGRITRPLRHNGTPYQGINVLLLWGEALERGFAAPIWMTFKQANQLGAQGRERLACGLCRQDHPHRAERQRRGRRAADPVS